MSSRTSRNHLVPDSPVQGPRASAPKGSRDAPPVTQSRYATPVTSGCDDDLPAPQGQGDALPASKGRYATPATPGCEDDSANPSKRRLSLPPRKSSSVTISGSKSPVSESASTVRRVPLPRTLLGPQQIRSILASQYGKKSSRKPEAFDTVLEQEQDEMPTPVETVLSARSTDTSS